MLKKIKQNKRETVQFSMVKEVWTTYLLVVGGLSFVQITGSKIRDTDIRDNWNK